MNPSANSKPKCKFSSRNLNAVFKAPIGTKPLPDNATRPLQRSTNHMLVLGRASVAPPSPLNTPSLKRESQVNNVHASLVSTGLNWAKKAEKFVQSEELKHSPDAVNVTACSTVLEKVWTPENVAEHLHTSSFVARPKMTVTNSGRWGDDAVEDDIVQNNIHLRIQREREFPDLKKTLEEMQTCRRHGHVSAAGEMQSVRPRQKPEQRHGRATGRWAHFNKEEMHHSMQDTCSRGRPHCQYERDEDDCRSRDQSSLDAYGLQSRRYEAKSNVGFSDPIDCHAHLSRSDVRFDTVAFDNGDGAMNYSLHRIDWGTAPLSHRDASTSSASPNKDSCVQTLQPFCSSSSPSVPASGLIALELASGREDHDNTIENHQCTNIVRSENEESSTPVVEVLQSSTKSSSVLLSHSSRSLPQLVELLKRPKMLFDPRTGGIVNAEDMTRQDKRQTDGRSGDKDRNAVRIFETSGSARVSKRTKCKREAQAKAPTLKSKSARAGRMEANLTPDIVDAGSSISQMAVVAIEQDFVVKGTACTSEASSTTSLNAVELMADQTDIKVAFKGRRVKRDSKRVTSKQPFGQEGKSQVTKPSRESRPSTSLTTRRKQQHRNSRYNTAVNVRGCSTSSSTKATDCIKYNIPMQCDRHEAVGNKPAQHGREREMQKPNLDLAGNVLLTSTAVGPNSGVVMQSDKQQDFKVSTEDGGGFETVKSRRAGLCEKKQLRERVIMTVAVAPLDEKKRDCASLVEHAAVPSKVVHEKKLRMVAKVSKVATQPAFRLRDKAANLRRNANKVTKDEKTKCVSKQATGTRECKKKEMPAKAKIRVRVSHPEMPEQVALRFTEQVAGEAPNKASLVTKSTKGTKATVKRKKDRQSDQVCKTDDPKRSLNIAGTDRQQQQSRRQGTKQSAHSGVQSVGVVATQPRKPDGITAKRKAKQVRQVYVVKTLAPASASATFTAV
ncbi:unnamed protein product [Peronospora destructor]|uniref:Uncharacterized protein n=1 Tax=Peronospora destructor TaxID=86335 RepID=A0AAV0VB83_9STRA|nr:unnamed protein product [Peronospora destructor]